MFIYDRHNIMFDDIRIWLHVAACCRLDEVALEYVPWKRRRKSGELANLKVRTALPGTGVQTSARTDCTARALTCDVEAKSI